MDENIIKSTLICSVCLGDNSNDANEIIECDGCGVTVHEGIIFDFKIIFNN